jgi:hypothetical protein
MKTVSARYSDKRAQKNLKIPIIELNTCDCAYAGFRQHHAKASKNKHDQRTVNIDN